MKEKETVHFCKNCVWYQNRSPEDICMNDKFAQLDVITGEERNRSCIIVRYSLNKQESICTGYKDIRKSH